jgi:hypothetical protein
MGENLVRSGLVIVEEVVIEPKEMVLTKKRIEKKEKYILRRS